MLSAVSRSVGSISNRFLILPTISCLVFVVFSVVVSIYVAHIVIVVVLRLTWLQTFLAGWMSFRQIPVGSSRCSFAVVGLPVWDRSYCLLGRDCCGPFGTRVGNPCFLLWFVCCMARSRRQKFVVFCSGNFLRSGPYNHKFGNPIWH